MNTDAALELARLADDDAFLCDFGGQVAVNLPNLDRVVVLGPAALQASPAPLDADRLRDFAEDVVRQWGYVSGGAVTAGGLSTLEEAFAVLGWDDPHVLEAGDPAVCDEPGCGEAATCGWPTRPGGTGPNGGYRRTCYEHMAAARLQSTEEPPTDFGEQILDRSPLGDRIVSHSEEPRQK